MSFTHKITSRWSSGGRQIEVSKDYTDEGQASISIAFAADADDEEVAFELDVSQIKSFFMVATQGLLVETNAADGSIDVVSLVANVPYIQTSDTYIDPAEVLILTDITKLYLTQTDGKAGQFDLRVVYDATI